jgi:hypothetical protein
MATEAPSYAPPPYNEHAPPSYNEELTGRQTNLEKALYIELTETKKKLKEAEGKLQATGNLEQQRQMFIRENNLRSTLESEERRVGNLGIELRLKKDECEVLKKTIATNLQEYQKILHESELKQAELRALSDHNVIMLKMVQDSYDAVKKDNLVLEQDIENNKRMSQKDVAIEKSFCKAEFEVAKQAYEDKLERLAYKLETSESLWKKEKWKGDIARSELEATRRLCKAMEESAEMNKASDQTKTAYHQSLSRKR